MKNNTKNLLSVDQVKKIAKLSRLQLTGQEIEKYRHQLNNILDYIDLLSEIDTSQVAPTTQTTGLTNQMRPDTPHTPLDQKKALGQAAQISQGSFSVKAVL